MRGARKHLSSVLTQREHNQAGLGSAVQCPSPLLSGAQPWPREQLPNRLSVSASMEFRGLGLMAFEWAAASEGVPQATSSRAAA